MVVLGLKMLDDPLGLRRNEAVEELRRLYSGLRRFGVEGLQRWRKLRRKEAREPCCCCC
jgi:hypothetical protein